MRQLRLRGILGYSGVLLGAALALAAPGPSDAEESGNTHQVLIERFAFVPPTLTIAQGDTVEWINRDIAPHTATDNGGAWDTAGLTKGQSSKVAFTAPGTETYICRYHPDMRGEIVVTPK